MSTVGVYDVGRTIGEGAYGTIHLARKHTEPRVRVVLKCIPSDKRVSYTQEVAAFTLLQATQPSHPHIVQLLDHFETPKQLVLVLEYIAGGDLHNYLEDHTMTTEQVRYTMRQVLDAMQFCHAQGLIVTDLKSENVLIVDPRDYLFIIKLCDFGMATTTTDNDGVYGTFDYVAPETFITYERTFSTDAWQTGILCYEMFAKTCPFEEEGYTATEKRIMKGEFTFPDTIPSEARDMIQKLLCTRAAERLTVTDALHHPFMV